MIWKCIYFCNLPKSVFLTLCQFVPSEAKLSDCQRECSNLPYSAFYPIILLQNQSALCHPHACGRCHACQGNRCRMTVHRKVALNFTLLRVRTCRADFRQGCPCSITRAAPPSRQLRAVLLILLLSAPLRPHLASCALCIYIYNVRTLCLT